MSVSSFFISLDSSSAIFLFSSALLSSLFKVLLISFVSVTFSASFSDSFSVTFSDSFSDSFSILFSILFSLLSSDFSLIDCSSLLSLFKTFSSVSIVSSDLELSLSLFSGSCISFLLESSSSSFIFCSLISSSCVILVSSTLLISSSFVSFPFCSFSSNSFFFSFSISLFSTFSLSFSL